MVVKMHDMLQAERADVGRERDEDDGGSGDGEGVGGGSKAAPAVPADRDVAQVRAADWIRRKLPRVTDRPRSRGFQAVMARSALNEMHRHGRAEPEVEVCGVLVGNVYRDDHGPYLHVEAVIRGAHAAGRTAQVTFTAETWNHINDELERHHPGRRILGWYHTHPGFGIFLSDMDLFIHNNFFPEPWQVAYVYDPKAEEDGLFLWKQGKATRGEYLTDPDTVSADPPKAKPAGDGPAPGSLADLAGRVTLLERKLKWLLAGMCVVAVLAVLLPLATGRDGSPAPADDPDAMLGDDGGGEPAIPPSLRLPPPASNPVAEGG
jgi:proteasome lid subunit RPN8/RPN11